MIQAREPAPRSLQQLPWISKLNHPTFIKHQNSVEIKEAIKTMSNHNNSMCPEPFPNNTLHFRVGAGIHTTTSDGYYQ